MAKVSITGKPLTSEKQKQIVREIEKCLSDSLLKNQEVTEVNIKIKTNKEK